MYDTQFWVKYVFRFFHISTVVALGGKIIYDYLFPCAIKTALSKGEIIFASVSGAILIIAGIVNIFLLKGKEKLKQKNAFWTGTLHLKAITCIVLILEHLAILFLTPLVKLISQDQEFVKSVQFYYVVSMLFLSPFLRFYREYWTEYNRNSKQH